MLTSFLIASCTGSDDIEKREIIDEIEENISLPEMAHNIERYARAYTEIDGRIVSAFFLPSEEGGQSCDFHKRTEENDSYAIAVYCPPPLGMRAGERRFFEAEELYSPYTDGGCSWIDIKYDPKNKSFEYIECHGEA